VGSGRDDVDVEAHGLAFGGVLQPDARPGARVVGDDPVAVAEVAKGLAHLVQRLGGGQAVEGSDDDEVDVVLAAAAGGRANGGAVGKGPLQEDLRLRDLEVLGELVGD
jgi:hypothetical protein